MNNNTKPTEENNNTNSMDMFGDMSAEMPVRKAKDVKGTLKRLMNYLSPYKFKLIIVVLCAVCSQIFGIVAPIQLGNVYDTLEVGIKSKESNGTFAIDFNIILNIVMILLFLYFLNAAFLFVQQYILSGVSQIIIYKMRKETDEKLARLPLKYYDDNTFGDILSRVTNDIETISQVLQQGLIQLITSILSVTGVTIMMFIISPILAGICLLSVPLCYLITSFITKRSQKYYTKQQNMLGGLNGHVEEMFTGHKEIKAFSKELNSVEKFKTLNEDLSKVAWKAQFVSGVIMPLLTFINNLGYVAVCIAGGLRVIWGLLSLGDIQAFLIYSQQFTNPIRESAVIINTIQAAIAASERVFELLDEPEEIKEKNKTIRSIKGNVVFHDITFGYIPEVKVIKNLDINIKHGSTVAIVGPTGTGKTTLVNLLMRFYDLDEGVIKIDNTDIAELKRNNLRSIFGMVLQDSWIFKGTIRENIAYGKENAKPDEIIRAAKTAKADRFIRTLPNGYDTILNEDGSNISLGQKQLITIARAALADPKILILDEATSSVDTRTEIQIQKAMTNLMKDRTSFVIAHRLSTIRDADIILVMKDGKLYEKGKHHELLQKGGFYAELYNSQFTAKNLISN